MASSTMFEKIWRQHVVASSGDGADLLHIDRHILHDMTSAKAFENLKSNGRIVHSPSLTIAVTDHVIATNPGRDDYSYEKGTAFVQAQRRNAAEFGLPLIDINDREQGIVHVVGPELGITLPGVTLACGDSHTCSHGALGALALGIGTSEVAHVLATQTLMLARPKAMKVTIVGKPGPGIYAKDIILHLISSIGADAGNGYVVEYSGPAVAGLPIEGRLTLCNMSVEWGARSGIIAPDDKTYEFISGRRYAPKGPAWDDALAAWRKLPSDSDARFDREAAIDISNISPKITWGTSPEHAIDIDRPIPDPDLETRPGHRETMRRALRYMDLSPGTRLEGLSINQVFIGSCTNSRISDLRAAAAIATGRKVSPGVRAMVVPGSSAVKRQAEAEGLDRIFKQAGFEWHESACSMCASANADVVAPFQRCVATSNRNYEGRQGRHARTHLASPATAAATAIAGKISDPRRLGSAP